MFVKVEDLLAAIQPETGGAEIKDPATGQTAGRVPEHPRGTSIRLSPQPRGPARLDGNPAEATTNLHDVRGVVRAGRYLPRRELDALQERVASLRSI